MQYHFAPVQGHTDAAYRHFHSQLFKGNPIYYTPFIRYERGGLRAKDIKDLTSDLNVNHKLIPQIIFRNEEEITELVKLLKELDAKEINLNMGCPFPLQTSHGRGAATISNENLAQAVIETVKNNPEIRFSVKMRLGVDKPDEWKTLLPYLNQLDLDHVTLHPRVAKQQYGGEVDLFQFDEFLKSSKNPVVYNGDLRTPADIVKIETKFPDIKGIMLGRGVLGRPTLIEEGISGIELEYETRLSRMIEFHRILFSHYSSVLCGDTQIINKIKPFWEYSEEEIGRKAWKAINKSSNLAKYQSAVALIHL